MKITNKLSLAAAVMTGVIATGCSQQTSQIETAVAAAAPAAVVAPRAAPAPRVVRAPVRRAPARRYNRWGHTHPAIPRCTKSIRHTHKYNKANHRHAYGCRKAAPRRAMVRKAAKPPVDVAALQRKLAAKGYYKGPIDGVVGPATRSALQRFMQR